MEFENFEDTTAALCKIDISDEIESKKIQTYACRKRYYQFITQQKFPPIPEDFIDFEIYIQNSCKNKIQILNRETFYKIKRPIVIFFNHFREKCAYLTKWLDTMYQMALQYGDRIDFIAADMIDIDVIYPETNPISFYCTLSSLQHESPYIYAIDEEKRIHKHSDVYKIEEHLMELCENLLNGNLFPSQPIPENNETNLVKICVHHNFKELVLNSTKNIFLIVENKFQRPKPNYDTVALALKDYNLDIVYMDHDKNYIPFEYFQNSFSNILFFPFNDKTNFIYYEDYRKEENIIEFLKNCIEKPEYLQSIQQQQSNRNCKAVKVSTDFLIDFSDLQQFLTENYKKKSIKVLNRRLLKKSKKLALLVFMNFQGKCSCQHVEWLNKLYQVVESWYCFDVFVADFKDINIINTKWKPEDMIKSAQGKPTIYAFDRLKNTYEFGNFDSITSLFYFMNSFTYSEFYYSQVYTRDIENDLVKVWVANYFKIFLKKIKKHIFITFYSSDDENTEKLSNLLELVANDVRPLNVEVAKFDVKFNYVSLEYAQESYPVHYFIPKTNKRDSRLYVDNNLSKDKMLEFIKNNI